MAEQNSRLDSGEMQGRRIVYVRGVPRNDFAAGDAFDWQDVSKWIYPAFRTKADEANGGHRHCGDAVLHGTGSGVSFQPSYNPKPRSTYMGSGFVWPGRFATKDEAKRAVEAEWLSRSGKS